MASFVMRVAALLTVLAVVALVATGGADARAACDATRPAVTYASGGPTEPAQPSSALIPCRYDTGGKALEPSLDFTRDGRILFQEWQEQPGRPDGAPLRPSVYRSDASFEHWQDVSPTIGPAQSLDPYLVVDRRTGRIFSVNFQSGTCATISFSDDDGATWTSSPAACGGFDGESIGTGPAVTSRPVDYPDLVYYCTGTTPASSQPTTTPLCTKSLDGGLTFVPTGAPPWPLVDAGAENDKFGPWAGNPVVGPDGTLYVPKRFAGQPEVAISHDEGATWARAKIAANGSAGETPRMAIDGRGRVYYAWTGANHRTYLAWSSDEGRRWSPPIDLTPPGVTDTALPRPAAAGDGRVFVAYLGSIDAPGRPPFSDYCNILLSPCDDGPYGHVAWNGYMTQVEAVLSAHPQLRTATVDPPSRPLLVGMCSADGGCKAELDFIDAKYSPSGQPFAAFVDDCALTRDFIPVFGEDLGRCGDNAGEGIVGTLAAGAGATGCHSRRTVTVHVPRRLRRRASRYDVLVTGRPVARAVAARRATVVDLRGRGRGAVSVVLRIRLRRGAVRLDRRRYHPCTAKSAR